MSQEPIHGAQPAQNLLKKYDCISILGAGGFGKVYLFKDKRTHQLRAIKCQEWDSKEIPKRVRREVNIFIALQKNSLHDNVVKFYEYFESPKVALIVTEYLGGGELFAKISSKDYNLTESKCRGFARQIFKGVDFIHKQNIVHLDLKPQNIVFVGSPKRRASSVQTNLHFRLTETDKRRSSLVAWEDDEECLKIIDFGLACYMGKETKAKTSLNGTVLFMAPEVINEQFATYASDMWSVGVILYMMLSGGSLPFDGKSLLQVRRKIRKRELCNGGFSQNQFECISKSAIDLIDKLLQVDHSQRLSAEHCLDQPWVKSAYLSTLQNLETAGIRRYLARRRWLRWFNTIKAINRMKKVYESQCPLDPNLDSLTGCDEEDGRQINRRFLARSLSKFLFRNSS